MHEINDLEYCVCNVMEDAVIEEESMKEIDQEGTSIPFYHFPSVVLQPTIILEYIFSHLLRQTMGC